MSDIIVSIGMIVKNEEKYMKACLESLKPLMDNVKCELVIVDTGSTDKTVEIAREYTDKIYFFEWVNDFSAARNFGLLKCVGEWFMYTDADTIFDTSEENMRPLIEFFNNEQLNKDYRSATYTTRNYFNPEHKEYGEHKELRITRRTPELRFVYPIHETFDCPNDKICFLPTYAHHYGYAFANLAEASEKSKRNSALLKKELERDPKNLRLQCLLFDSLIDHSEKAKVIEKALAEAKTSNEAFAPVAYARAVKYFVNFDYKKAAVIAEEYITRIRDDATLIDVYYKLGFVRENLHEFDEALSAYKKCHTLQRLYKEEKLDMTRLTFIPLEHIGETAEADVFRRIVFCMVNLGKSKEAYDFWEKEHSEFSNEQAFSVLENIINVSKKYSKLCGIYERFSEDDEVKKEAFEVFLEKQYYKAGYKERFIDELSKARGDFGEMMRLIKLAGTSDFTAEAEKLLENFKWREGFSELVYLLLSRGYDIRKILPSLDFNRIRAYIDKISFFHDDFAELVFENCRPFDYVGSMMEVLWLVTALEAGIFSKKQNPSNKLGIYKDYVNILTVYVANLYNRELLNNTDINALPDLHRFGYHMINAQKKLDSGDKIGYIREIKNGLISCECAKDIAVALTDDFLARNG